MTCQIYYNQDRGSYHEPRPDFCGKADLIYIPPYHGLKSGDRLSVLMTACIIAASDRYAKPDVPILLMHQASEGTEEYNATNEFAVRNCNIDQGRLYPFSNVLSHKDGIAGRLFFYCCGGSKSGSQYLERNQPGFASHSNDQDIKSVLIFSHYYHARYFQSLFESVLPNLDLYVYGIASKCCPYHRSYDKRCISAKLCGLMSWLTLR